MAENVKEFRRVSRVRWKIYYLRDKTKGMYDSEQELLVKVFDINPTSFDVEPQQRLTLEQTMGGVMPVAWIGNRDSWHGYDRVVLVLSGSWNVFIPRDLRLGRTEGRKTVMQSVMDSVADKLGIGEFGRDRYWVSIQAKKKTEDLLKSLESDRKVESYKKMKAGLLELFYLINQPYFSDTHEGKIVAGKWILEIASVVFARSMSETGSDESYRRLSFNVVPVAPMVIRERVDRPFLPEWSVRFAILNEDVRKFFEVVDELAKELNPNRAETGV